MISKLIKAVHLLDLRRIPSFNMKLIKFDISNIAPDSNILYKLWDQSGKYLDISGDRDLVINKNFWSDRFFTLHQDSKKLYF